MSTNRLNRIQSDNTRRKLLPDANKKYHKEVTNPSKRIERNSNLYKSYFKQLKANIFYLI